MSECLSFLFKFKISSKLITGSSCTDSNECVGIPDVSSECTEGNKCFCLGGYVASNNLDDCLIIVNMIGEECAEDQQCKNGAPGFHSECQVPQEKPWLKVCNCTTISINEPGGHVCLLKANKVGDPCQSDAQCVANLVYAHCPQGTCNCHSNTVPSSNNTRCLPKAEKIGSECIEDVQCQDILHTTCLISNLTEMFGSCQCAEDYVAISNGGNEVCVKLASQIGDSCTEGGEAQCSHLPGTSCNATSQTCECSHPDEIPSGEKDRCLPIKLNLNEECEDDAQCMVADSVCFQNGNLQTCECNPTSHVQSVRVTNKCLEVSCFE